MCATKREAFDVAEKWRERGSWFEVEEVPVLLLGTALGPVAVAEFHTQNCFAKWSASAPEEVLRIGTPAGEAIRSLGRLDGVGRFHPDWGFHGPSEQSFILGLPAWSHYDHIATRNMKFKTLISAPDASDYRLAWRASSPRTRAAAVVRIVTLFNAVNGPTVAEADTRLEGLYAQRCIDAHAALTGDEEARARLESIGTGEDDWLSPALAFAPSDMRIYRGPAESFMEMIFGGSVRTDPEETAALVEQIDAVLDTFSEREANELRRRCQLWGYSETVVGMGRPLSTLVSMLRHPSRSQVLRDYLLD